MKVLRVGHQYELASFEPAEHGQVIQFIEKEKVEGSTDLKTIYNGTTNEEVIAALIDRISYLQGLFPCKENACAITRLEEALMWLEKRVADRIKRNVKGQAVK